MLQKKNLKSKRIANKNKSFKLNSNFVNCKKKMKNVSM